jgi:hypothetical protein
MPREVLVLLAVFLLLPLLQQLLGAVRQRTRHSAEPLEKQRPMTQPPLGPAPSDPTVSLPNISVAPEGHSTPAQIRAPARLDGPGAPVARQRTTQGHRASGTHERGLGLQQAIRLMAVLGPCRANRSYEWPESPQSQ